jgi:hypothetical protein
LRIGGDSGLELAKRLLEILLCHERDAAIVGRAC